MELLAILARTLSGRATDADLRQVVEAQQCMATGERAAAASFTPDRGYDSATQPYPYPRNRSAPCDIDQLTLWDAGSGRRVQAKVPTSRRTYPEATADAPDRVRKLSSEYDTVLEVVAGYASEEPLPPAKAVSLRIEARYAGICLLKEHALVRLTPVGYADLDEGPFEWRLTAPTPVRLLASSGRGHSGSSPPTWISPFWFSAKDAKELAVEAASCGVQSPGGGVPVTRLNGLVRIYRDEVHTISCRVPPFPPWKRERRGSTGLQAAPESRGAATTVYDDPKPTELQLQVSLKRNGRELGFAGFAHDLISLHQGLSAAWNDIQHWVPQVGWSVALELSLLQGEIAGQWGYRPTEKWRSDAYCWVERFYEFTINVKVLSYRAEISFGLDFSIPALLAWFGAAAPPAVVLQATGEIAGAATLSKTLVSSAAAEPVEIAGSSRVDLQIQSPVTACGYTYDARSGIAGGIQFRGQLVCSWEQCPRITGTAFFAETKVGVRLIDGVTGDHSDPYERIMFKRKQIWQGSLPEVGP